VCDKLCVSFISFDLLVFVSQLPDRFTILYQGGLLFLIGVAFLEPLA